MTTALDTSVLVAALASWHESHDRCRLALSRLLSGETTTLVPDHALVEAYSVLTRLPVSYRMSPDDALDLLRGALASRVKVVSERSTRTWALLSNAASIRTAGGAIHDLRILRAARAGGAEALLTLNPRDFERFEPVDIRIVVP